MFKKKKNNRPDEIAAFVFAADAQEALEKLKQKYRLTPDSFGGFAACFPKPKFNIDEWQGKYAMHCENQEELFRLYDYLHSVGRKWSRGSSYKEFRPTETFDGKATRYIYFNNGLHSPTCGREYTVLNFKDFDWSDFDMKETFTKADLKPGMVVEYRNGERRLFVNGKFMGIYKFGHITDFTDQLKCVEKHNNHEAHDIVKVYTTIGDTINNIFDSYALDLIWERSEAKEMTVAEIEEKLGFKVKVIADKE